MSGCYGNSQEDRMREAELHKYLDETYGQPEKREEEIAQLARDKFMSLPDMYTCRDSVTRWTNMEDAADGLKQDEWIAIARALRDGDNSLAGQVLKVAIMRVVTEQAECEIDDRE